MLRRISSMTLIVAFALIASQGQEARAQSVPYKSFGTNATFNSDTGEIEGVGNGAQMGKHDFSGFVVPDVVMFPEPGIFLSGTFTGIHTVTAANGDTLNTLLSGTVVLDFDGTTGLASGVWLPTFTVISGTGRFANASGTFDGVAINPPFDPSASPIWGFNWFVDSKIDLGK